jgi:hypothetical protein
MSIQTVEWPNKYHYVDCHGCHRFIGGLPLAQRMEWLHLFRRFHALRLELAANEPDLLFWHFYDELNGDFSGNPHYNPEFKALVDTLLKMHGIDPGGVSAEMAVVFLVGDKTTGDKPVLLALEYPDKYSGEEPGEAPPDGVSEEAWSKAHIIQYAGSPTAADELLRDKPYVEVLEEIKAWSSLMNNSQSPGKKPRKGNESVANVDMDSASPNPVEKAQAVEDPQSREEALKTMAEMKALFEKERLSIYAAPATLPGFELNADDPG